jgi:hypothetical protein
MADAKITITHDELYSPAVDARLKQQEARARAGLHYRVHGEGLALPEPAKRGWSRLWYNPVLATALFGLLGGLLAWGPGEVIMRTALDSQLRRDFAEMRKVMKEEEALFQRLGRGELNQLQFQEAQEKLYREHARNPIIAILTNKALKEHEQEMLVKELVEKEKPRMLLGEVLYLSVLGVCLACLLAVADSVLGRNWRAAVINGSVGILLGMIGGVLVSLFIDRLYHFLGGGDPDGPFAAQMRARTLCWGVLGLFLAVAPGVVLRNRKRLLIGLAGGLIGGLLGGLLFDPIGMAAESGLPARLIALAVIGILAGAATGLIEQAAKRGWLYVTAGLIAGKQFILYRTPTFLGSSPQCEIYLFKDPDISPRHAAIHRLGGGFELEDLGSATGTRVNGRPVTRARLRPGDHVQIGGTCFVFQERVRAGSADPKAPAPGPRAAPEAERTDKA